MNARTPLLALGLAFLPSLALGETVEDREGAWRKDRTALGLAKDHLALRAKGVGQYGKHAAAKNAGWQKEDVITELDGSSERATEGMVIGRLVRLHKPGEKVKATVLRGGKKVELFLPIQ